MTESTSAPNISKAVSSLTTPRRCPETRAHYAHRWAPGGMWAECPGGPQEDASPSLVAAERERVLAEVEALARDLVPPPNCELRYDGSSDPRAEAWVDGRHEAVGEICALVARLRGQA